MCYTSQLNVTVSADVVEKSIECHYDDSSTTTSQLVGATSIIRGKTKNNLAV